jgi:hypothetical protein
MLKIDNLDEQTINRIISKISIDGETGCWNWIGQLNHAGYGKFYYHKDGKRHRIHKFMYIFAGGNVPDGYELDNLCRNRNCCNPAHLEPVTHAENMFRARRTHCRRGHLLSNDLITKRKNRGSERRCRECEKIRAEKVKENKLNSK